MQKFDESCGISKNEIYTIKWNVKNHILRKLPELPDIVETKLFLQGRDAWIFNWSVINEKYPIEPNEILVLEVIAKLKKEFHNHIKITHYNFLCNVWRQQDMYHPKITITKKKA